MLDAASLTSLPAGQEVAGLDYPDDIAMGADGPGESPLGTAAPTGTTPTQMRHAYGFDQISFNGGAVTANGSGTTIAIVDAYNDPTIVNDLHAFDSFFSIANPPSFTVMNETGGSTLPGTDPAGPGSDDWETEESIDVEWAHAIAPGANLILVEATTNAITDLDTADATAAAQPGVVAVSMSYGGSEYAGEVAANNSIFVTPKGHTGVTFVASSGDLGAPPSEPAILPNVLAVGGTTLNVNSSGTILSESGWSGSGGGVSLYESQPSYQVGVVTQSHTVRTNPDVAYDANPSTGVPIYDSYDFGTSDPWAQYGGTSIAAPQWSSLIAIADQGRALVGLGSLDGPSQTLPLLYSLPSSDFHDITTGSSTGIPSYSAGPGYDLVTGLGSPVANQLVADLGPNGVVTSSVPAVGLTVTTAPASYALNFALPVNPASLQANDFTVNGIAASSVSLNGAGTTATFTFTVNPVTGNGPQTMQLAANTVSLAGNSTITIAGFSGNFISLILPLEAPTINWPTPAGISYGTDLGPAQLDATASFGGSAVVGDFNYSPPAGVLVNAGASQTLQVTFSPDDPYIFSTVMATVSINVAPVPLMVTVGGTVSKVYGAANPAFSVAYQGFVSSDTSSVLGGSLTFSTTATAASGVGTYTVSASGLTSTNYTINFVSGTLTVTPAPLVVTPDNQSQFYGAVNPTLTGTITGLENNDPITAVYSTAATPTSAAGSTFPISTTLNDPTNQLGNYTVTINSGTLTISPAPLVVTPNSFTRFYGAANPVLSGTLTGIENGDAITASFSTTASASSPAGPYSITAAVSGANLSDYTVMAGNGTLTVNPAPLAIAVANASQVYGAANPPFAVGYLGFVLGQDPTALAGNLTFSSAVTATSPVGAYTLSASGLTSSNYAISFASGTLTVNPAPLVVTPVSQSRYYGAANPTLTGTITGLENNDQITPAYSTSAAATSDAGTYPISTSLNAPPGTLGNYTVVINPGSLTITPAPLVVTANSLTRLYGAANPTLTGTLTGVQNGDAITASFSTPASASSPAGPYNITAALSGAKLYDYTVTANPGTLTVNPAPLVVAVASGAQVYGTNPAFNVGYQGFVLGQDPTALGGNLAFITTATAASGVGTYTVSATGLTSSNYAISFASGTLTVTPAPLVVTPDNLTQFYGADTPTLTGTITGLENNDPITADYSTFAAPTSDAGTYPITTSLNAPAGTLGNYMLTINPGTLTIAPAPLVVTPESFARTYGAANPTLSGTITGIQNDDAITAAFSISANAASPAGPYSITAVVQGGNLYDYAVTVNPATLTVNQAPLVVAVSSQSKVYGQPNPTFSVHYQGFVLGQTASVLAGQLAISTTATAASGAGNYAVTASGVTSSNYAINFTSGSLAVTPAPLRVTAGNQSRAYGAANPTLTGTITGLENNDPIAAVYSTSATPASDTGTDPITATLNDPASKLGNYTVTIIPGTLTIAPAPLVVTPNSFTRLYGAANPALTGTISGIQNGDALTASYSTPADATSPAGPYGITAVLSGMTLNDYTVTAGTGTLNVSPAPLVVTVADASKVYGAANPTLTGTITGLVNNDPITAVYSTTATPASGAGADPITATLSDPDNRLGNYMVAINPGSLTITPAPLMVTPDSFTRLYGADNPEFTGTVSGIQNDDVLTASYSTPGDAGSAVGSYDIDASLAGANLQDYDVTASTGTLTVTPAPLMITVADASRSYGVANPAFAVTYQGYLLGQDASVLGGTLTYSTPATAASGPGGYTVSASGLTSNNYTISYAGGTLMVTPALLVVTPGNQSRVYGAANPVLSGTIAGIQNNDPITATYATSADATSDVGTYAITATLQGDALGDYTVTNNPGTLTITPAPLMVTPDNLVKTYGAANPPLTGTLSGVQNGDAITASFSTPADDASAVGPYAITAALAGANLQDYAVTANTGTLTIQPASLVVGIADPTKVYGAPNPAFGTTFQGFVLGQDPSVLGGTMSFATTADSSSPVGDYSVTPGGLTAANYGLSFAPGTLTVTPAPLTVRPADVSRVYGAANPALTGTITGLQNDDAIAASYTTAGVATSAVGAYPIVATLSDPAMALGNYTVTMNTGTLTVTPAPLMVTPDSLVKTYGDTAVLTGQVTGPQQGDTFTVTYASTGAAAEADAGGYPIMVANVSGANLADYDVMTNQATLTVNPAPLTVTADDATMVAGEANPSFTASYAGFVPGQGPGVLMGALSFQTPAGPSSPAGMYPVTPGGLQATDYTITYVAGALNVTPAPPAPAPPVPLVTVSSAQLQTEKLSKKKTAYELVVNYSGALEPGPAQAVGSYQVSAAAKGKKPGSHVNKPVAIASATYNSAASSVTLTLAAKPPGGPLQLTIVGSAVLDAEGRGLDGNKDGQSGGNYQTTVG